MKTLEIKLKVDGVDKKIHLRLTARGQKRLKEKYDENMLSTLMSAVEDIDRAVDILDTALNYKDNDNEITDGEVLYDLLVENGRCGSEDFAKVLTDIAVNSGIIKKDQANSVMNTIKATYEDIFNSLDDKVKKIQEENGTVPVAGDNEEETDSQSDSTPL